MRQHTHGKIIEKFRADNLDLKTALALFASQNDLNIVVDNDVEGLVTLDVHNLPLDQMMDALLDAGDCSWSEDNGLIRVRNTETGTYVVDYLRLRRNGLGHNTASLSDTGPAAQAAAAAQAAGVAAAQAGVAAVQAGVVAARAGVAAVGVGIVPVVPASTSRRTTAPIFGPN